MTNPLQESLGFQVREFFRRMSNPVANGNRGFKRVEGAEKHLGIKFDPLSNTFDELTGAQEEPINLWANVPRAIMDFNTLLSQAGDVVRRKPLDPEIWSAVYPGFTPEQVIASHASEGGLAALKTVHRVRPGEFWRRNEADLRSDEVPVAMLAKNYGEVTSRISFGAWNGNRPLVLVADDQSQNVFFETSFVESMGHGESEKLGFKISPGKMAEVWHDNVADLTARDDTTRFRLREIAERRSSYRPTQLIFVNDMGNVDKQNRHLLRDLHGLARLGSQQGGVGIGATMTPADVIRWSERGTQVQMEFLTNARFLVGMMLDSVTATHLGKTLAPRVEMEPENLAEKLLDTGGSKVIFVDDHITEPAWMIG